jgi:sterol desaturase/sphingolipid hydroxylase (fatty acid hydroxylase superfamily)
LTLLPSQIALAHTGDWHQFRALVSSQPIWLQFIEIMFLTDFVQYWLHRAFHRVPFLWRFHAVHHSAKTMDWLAGSRMHLVEIVCLRGLTVIPMQVLGFDQTALYAYLVTVYLYATYVHANLRFDIEFIKPLLVTPRFHHWHHGIEPEAIDVNFAVHFPILDRLFGTYYMPARLWPSGYGVGGHPVPTGFMQQMIYPFQREKKQTS